MGPAGIEATGWHRRPRRSESPRGPAGNWPRSKRILWVVNQMRRYGTRTVRLGTSNATPRPAEFRLEALAAGWDRCRHDRITLQRLATGLEMPLIGSRTVTAGRPRWFYSLYAGRRGTILPARVPPIRSTDVVRELERRCSEREHHVRIGLSSRSERGIRLGIGGFGREFVSRPPAVVDVRLRRVGASSLDDGEAALGTDDADRTLPGGSRRHNSVSSIRSSHISADSCPRYLTVFASGS